MYKIGLFSQITKTTIKTLRYYDRVELLKPNVIDKFNNYRYYSTEQISQFYEILSYRQAGLSINEIKQIILNKENPEHILDVKREELKTIQIETDRQISLINYLLKERKEGFLMEYKAVVKDLPECIVYSKEMVVADYNSYFEIVPKIGEAMTKANPNLKCREPEYCFIKYLANEYKEKNIPIEFCEAVEEFGNETEDIKFKKLESIKAVCIIHKGPYTTINKAYMYAFSWMEHNDYELSDSPRECQIDGIWNKETEEDWLTEVQFPIQKK